jgi:ATP-dependent Clp protease protease subunit
MMPEVVGLKSDTTAIKTKPVEKTITLEAKNTVILKGPVTSRSVAEVQKKVLDMSFNLSKRTPIYLVLDTPGGSVFAGLQMIDFLRALDQKVHTVTLFAASMGFQIAQNMDTRYIGTSSTLMSHRARLGGLGGQLDGEFESRYNMIKRQVDYLDTVAAKRMKMSLEQYKQKIVNEYWIHGYDSVRKNAADEQVNLKCGKSLNGTVPKTYRSMFGLIDVEFSECPLIKGPLSVNFRGEDKNIPKLRKLSDDMFNNEKYVREYIVTGKHYNTFGF